MNIKGRRTNERIMNSAEVIHYPYRLCGFLHVRDKDECLIETTSTLMMFPK